MIAKLATDHGRSENQIKRAKALERKKKKRHKNLTPFGFEAYQSGDHQIELVYEGVKVEIHKHKKRSNKTAIEKSYRTLAHVSNLRVDI